MRSSYGIDGDVMNDIFVSVCCFPCSANQIYQTSKTYGNPTSNGGKRFNTGSFNLNWGNRTIDCCCIYCCPLCSNAESLNRSLGMPYILGFCCIHPYSAQNLIRYQHRIRGSDITDELFCSTIVLLVFAGSAIFWPLLLCSCPCLMRTSRKVSHQSSNSRPSTRYLLQPDTSIEIQRDRRIQPTIIISAPRIYPSDDLQIRTNETANNNYVFLYDNIVSNDNLSMSSTNDCVSIPVAEPIAAQSVYSDQYTLPMAYAVPTTTS